MRKISSNKINSKLSKIAKKKKKDKARREKSRREKDLNKKNQKLMNEKLASIIDRLPKQCSVCSTVLDSENDQHLDKWKMSLNSDGISMICESCQE